MSCDGLKSMSPSILDPSVFIAHWFASVFVLNPDLVFFLYPP